MSPKLEGGCQCGHVRYEIEGAPLGLAVCHCNGCQRQSGSAFGMSLAISGDQFSLLRGGLKSFEVDCDSGRRKTCSFCPECGVRIHHRDEDGHLSIKAGTLDDRTMLWPDAHYWTAEKQAWVEIPDGVPAFLDDH
jgi:hypothetical protein